MPARVRTAPASYLKLVNAFPLVSIRTDAQLAEAQTVLDALLQKEQGTGERLYLDALTDLIETYEHAAHPLPDAPEADVLRVLLESNGLTQPQLAKAVGIAQSTLSAVLNGSRSLTKEHIVKLAAHFKVSPAAFLPRG